MAAVAGGINLLDPTNGLFEMLKPLQINRSNVDAYREGTMKVNLDDILRNYSSKFKMVYVDKKSRT